MQGDGGHADRALTTDQAVRLFAAAVARHRDGDLPAAARLYQEVAALRPSDAAPLINLGSALAGQGLAGAAATVLKQAVALAPDLPQSYNNLGAALIDGGAYAAGLAACQRALRLRPDNPEAENNLGNALVELDRTDEAAAAFCRALALSPAFLDACTNLSGALLDRGACHDAVLACRRAIRLAPEDAKPYNNLGNALRGAGALDAAAGVFERAIRLAPDDAEIHYNAAAVLLKQGRLAEGWAAYEWRKRTSRSPFRLTPLPGPEWDGGALAGRTLLLYGEQGYGDVLQFVRFAPLLAERLGGTVLLRVYPPLVRLCEGLPCIAGVVSTSEPLPDYHCHFPLMSLPWLLGTDLESIPATVPYLSADPGAASRWRERLRELDGGAGQLRVGLVWAGDPRESERGTRLMDRRRSLALAAFDEALRLPGIRWVSLQKGTAAGQARTPPPGTAWFDPMDEIGDFADTAALVAALDLVVTVDTAMAHLAGALGKPVWILSRFDGCWRWLEGREDSPWYPTVRLFRQAAWGDWRSTLAELAAALSRMLFGGIAGAIPPKS